MKIKVITNLKTSTNEISYGIAIMPAGSRRYCKYPMGYQGYKTIQEAEEMALKIQKEFKDSDIQYATESRTNKNESVLLKKYE